MLIELTGGWIMRLHVALCTLQDLPVYFWTTTFVSGSSSMDEFITILWTSTSTLSSENCSVILLSSLKSVPLFITYFPFICKEKAI